MERGLTVPAMLAICSLILLVGAAIAGSVTYTYDSAGRLTKADYGQGRTITYTYSNSGSLLERRTTISSGTGTAGAIFRFR